MTVQKILRTLWCKSNVCIGNWQKSFRIQTSVHSPFFSSTVFHIAPGFDNSSEMAFKSMQTFFVLPYTDKIAISINYS